MAKLHYGTQFEFGDGASQIDSPEEVDLNYDLDENMNIDKQEEEGRIAHSNRLMARPSAIELSFELHLTL